MEQSTYLGIHFITKNVDKMRGAKMSVFVHAKGIKSVHAVESSNG